MTAPSRAQIARDAAREEERRRVEALQKKSGEEAGDVLTVTSGYRVPAPASPDTREVSPPQPPSSPPVGTAPAPATESRAQLEVPPPVDVTPPPVSEGLTQQST